MHMLHEMPHRPRTLVDAAATSRRSIQRTLAELTERKWVRKEDGHYHLTANGRAVFSVHKRYIERLELVGHHEPLFRHLPQDHLPEPEWLRGAESTYSTPARPQDPMYEYMDWLDERSCETLRCLAPGCNPLVSDVYERQIDDGTSIVEVVGAPSNDGSCPIGGREAFRRCVHPDRIAFGLALAERCSAIRAYDEQTRLRAFVKSTDERLLSWLEGLFERYYRQSRSADP